MSKFNEHQFRLWNRMIKFIGFYQKNTIEFSQLISELHGSLQAGEFKDQELIKKWYDFWAPLEIYYAVRLDEEKPIIKEEIIKDVERMRVFLVSQIEKEIKANPDLSND